MVKVYLRLMVVVHAIAVRSETILLIVVVVTRNPLRGMDVVQLHHPPLIQHLMVVVRRAVRTHDE